MTPYEIMLASVIAGVSFLMWLNHWLKKREHLANVSKWCEQQAQNIDQEWENINHGNQ